MAVSAAIFGALWARASHQKAALRAANVTLLARQRALSGKADTEASLLAAEAHDRGYAQGISDTIEKIFVTPYKKPFVAGSWYLVQMSPKGIREGFAAAWDVTPNNGEAWAVENGSAVTYDVGRPSTRTNTRCTYGVNTILTGTMSCSERIALFDQYLAGTLASWTCTGDANAGHCDTYGDVTGLPTASFSWN